MSRRRLLFIGALLLSGCSVRRMALQGTVGLLRGGDAAIYEENDAQFARESMASQLKLVEVLLKSDPMNPDLLLSAAQGFGGYAFLFLEEKEPERAKQFYARARAYGFKALEQRAGAGLRAEPALELFAAALKNFTAGDAAALFWTAYAWGGMANLSLDNPEELAGLPKVELMMRRVDELSPGFFYGGPDLFLGAYFGSRPKMFGGDLEKSRAHFDRAVQASGGKFLMAYVLYARHYAVPAQDKDLFRRLLQPALSGSHETLPEQGLANAVAKERAKKLMEEIDELF